MEKLGKLKTLKIFGVDLAVAGAGADRAGDGALEIVSESLSPLELMGSKASVLTLRHAQSLGGLARGEESEGEVAEDGEDHPAAADQVDAG